MKKFETEESIWCTNCGGAGYHENTSPRKGIKGKTCGRCGGSGRDTIHISIEQRVANIEEYLEGLQDEEV